MLAVLLGMLQISLVSLLIFFIELFNVWFGEGNDVVGVCDSGFDNYVKYF